MTGFDISSIGSSLGGFDPMKWQQDALTVMSGAKPSVQDPERVGPKPRDLGIDTPVRDGRGFEGLLTDSIERVQSLQDDSRNKLRGLAMGEDVDLHDVMIASNKSEVAFNLVLEIRNKLLDAWEKLSRSVT
jgi:flagellar hook-basal body complex protein FliE